MQRGPETAVCDRRLEGLAGGDPRRVRGRAAGAALPRPQVAQRPGPACRSQSGNRCGRRCGPPGGQDPKTVCRAKLEKLAQWLERDCPAAAASLREGLEECFTINRLGLPASLHRCLATTNLIESPQAGVRLRTRRVCRWRDAAMVQRWVASSFLATEKNFRRLMGYQDLWMLKAILEGSKSATRREVA